MKKSHIAVIALSLSIAVLALFAGNTGTGSTPTEDYGYATEVQ